MSEVLLSPEQQAVLETWGQGVAVMAGAGAGKTTTLVMKCEALLKRNPEAKFVAVSFTERSTSDLRAKLSGRLPNRKDGGPLSSHWVMTIHGLCGAVLREFPREAGFDGEEQMLSEAESQVLWEQALDSIWGDELPDSVRGSVDRLLLRETRAGLNALLRRARSLSGFGALKKLSRSLQDETALAIVAEFVIERFTRLKRRRGAIDFDDLERGADRALEHTHVRESFHRRFDLVLIDEFQDTNALQASILWRFARPDLSNLCVVGDPKQSIYRFRDADVSVFDDCVSQLPVRLSLTWNFRSRPGIIEYANAVCADLFAASSMKFEPLVPKREAIEEKPVVRLDLRDPAALGRWIQSDVARGIPLSAMALLVRKIRGNEKWFRALNASGIPLAIASGGLFWEDARVREMVALLRWWENPANTMSAAVFMRAPWMGVPDSLIDAWIRQDKTMERPFFAYDHPISRALKALEGRPVSPSEVLAAAMESPESERELGAAYLGLWHRVEELSARGLDFRAVVAELVLSVEESRREREVPPPKNEGTLQILTLHGAKGLEFDHVILVDFGKKPRPGDMPLLFWDRVDGTYLGGRNEDGDRLRTEPTEDRWRKLEKAKELAESMRVFYVGLTRARERLVLGCEQLDEKHPKDLGDREKAYVHDFWRAWIEIGPQVPVEVPPDAAIALTKPADEAISQGPLQKANREEKVIRPRHSVTEWTMLSRCPRSYEWTFIRPRTAAEKGQMDFFAEPPALQGPSEIDARELGTRVHACFEHSDWEGLRAIEDEVGPKRFRAEPVIEWATQGEGAAIMAGPREGREVWAELAFEIPVEREILVGSIDRLVCESSKRYTLVDFKITRELRSNEDLLASYAVQAELYAAAIHRLEPKLSSEAVTAALVNISPEGVRSVTVPVSRDRVVARSERLAKEASLIVAGASGVPTPGRVCRHCEFRSICPEGRLAGSSAEVPNSSSL
jgi:ATP-dependent helicase/nuclease subunit A